MEDHNESTMFFKKGFRDDDDLEYEHIIMNRDFNVAPNHADDTSGYLHVNNLNTRRFLKIPYCHQQPY